MTLLVVTPLGGHADRLALHLTMFAIAASTLLLTAALGDGYHPFRQHRSHR
jgi:hypothetical protein